MEWSKNNMDTILAGLSLVITIVYGFWGVHLSKQQIKLSIQQDSTAVDLLHFKELLQKTDTVITLSTNQLKINQELQERANTIYENSVIGNMNRLTEKLHRIDAEFININGSNYGGRLLTEDDLREFGSKLGKLKNLFVSEMDNPYVNSNDTIYKLWSLAYSNVGELDWNIELELSFIGSEIQNLNTNKVEIKKVDSEQMQKTIQRIYGKIFTSVGYVTGYTKEKIKKDKIQRGLLDDKGNSKINPIDYYK